MNLHLKKHGALTASLLMCLFLGVVLAVGVDALTSEDDITHARWITIGTSLFALTVTIALFDRITRPLP